MERKTTERLAFTFHCAAKNGAWLGLEGPVSLEPEVVADHVTALLAGVPGCCEVSVWIEHQRILTATRPDAEIWN